MSPRGATPGLHHAANGRSRHAVSCLMRHCRRFAALVALGAPAVARADAVTQWNINANAAIFASKPTSHASTLSFAMVQGAVYDAVNGIDGGYQPYLVSRRPIRWYSQGCCGRDCGVPRSRRRRSVLSDGRAREPRGAVRRLARCDSRPGPRRTAGSPPARAAAAAMLAARANDGRNPTTPFPFVFGTTPGVWRVSPPLTTPDPTPWVGNVTPFLVPNAEMLRTDGPNALTSKAYARTSTRSSRSARSTSTTRTADQTNAAIFWQSQPLGLYGGVMRSLSARFGLSTAAERPPVRDGEPRRGRRRDRLLERQVLLELLAADRRDPPGRDRRQPGDRGRPDLAAAVRPGDGDDAAARDAELPGPPVGAQLREQRDPEHDARSSSAPTRSAFDIVSTRFPGTPAQTRHYDSFSSALEEVDQRARLGRHPLPHRRRAGREARPGRSRTGSTQHYFKPLHGDRGDVIGDDND